MQSTFRYDVLKGTAGNDFDPAGGGVGILDFVWAGVTGVTRILEMKIWDQPAIMKMSYDGVEWGPEFELDQDDPPMQIPHAAREFQIKNKTAGLDARFQIIGFW